MRWRQPRRAAQAGEDIGRAHVDRLTEACVGHAFDEALRRPRHLVVHETRILVFGLHLRGSTRGWFMSWLAGAHPELVERYRELYRRSAYLPPSYRDRLRRRAAPLLANYKLGGEQRQPSPAAEAAVMPKPMQQTLF